MPAMLEPAAATSPRHPYGSVDGQLVYAVGDVHGCYALLQDLLGRIEHDATSVTEDLRPILIFCGDYVDRGPDSARVLDALCWLRRHAPYDVHFLKGNHEQVMLGYITDPGEHRDWMRFGGAETLRSYGVNPPAADDDVARHVEARDDLLERLPVAHLTFLNDLKLMLSIGDFVFVHAGLRPGKPLSDQSEADLLWIREEFLGVTEGHDRIVVHGHTWTTDQPALLPHRIGIDTGAYATGVLTAIRIQDGKVATIAVRSAATVAQGAGE
jgi:serine/threonine protein phosphatase 1